MNRIEIHKEAYAANFIYLLKCLTGIIICYALYSYFPQYPFYWSLVSVAVSLSPDNSNTLAYDRMKANIIGCAAGICLYPIHTSNLIILCLGVTLTIFIGIVLRMTHTLKSALAAVVIITLQEEQEKHWYVALERVSCVVTGCIVALGVALLFNLLLSRKYSKQ